MGQNDVKWLSSIQTEGTEKERGRARGEGGSPFQRLHAVPINSCENGDGSCEPHEVILQACMENIGL